MLYFLYELDWRTNEFNLDYDTCVDKNGNCVGGVMGNNTLCKAGHKGALCEVCDLDGEDPYMINGDLDCIKCSESLTREPIIIGALIYRLFFLYIGVSGTLYALEDKTGFNSLKVLFNTHEPTPN